MKFSTREDIEAPIDAVFARVTEFDAFERQALRRGAEVRRINGTDIKAGTQWNMAFVYRGKDRNLKATLAEFDPPNRLEFETLASGLEGQLVIDLVPLSPRRTRLAMSLDLKPKSISARLLLQSLKLAKSNLTQRYKKRVADFAEDIEDRHRRSST